MNNFTFDSDEDSNFDLGEGNAIEMAALKDTAVTSAVEAHETSSSSYYHKSADNEDIHDNNGNAATDGMSGRYEMDDNNENAGEDLAPVIEAIESKKKVWYAYLTTWDFWIVVILVWIDLPEISLVLRS